MTHSVKNSTKFHVITIVARLDPIFKEIKLLLLLVMRYRRKMKHGSVTCIYSIIIRV